MAKANSNGSTVFSQQFKCRMVATISAHGGEVVLCKTYPFNFVPYPGLQFTFDDDTGFGGSCNAVEFHVAEGEFDVFIGYEEENFFEGWKEVEEYVHELERRGWKVKFIYRPELVTRKGKRRR